MKRFLTPLLLLAFVATIFTACSNTSRIIATGLEVDITLIERSSDGTVSVSWQVKNANIVPYLFSRVNMKLQLNGTPIGSIDETEALALPQGTNAGRTSKLSEMSAAGDRVLTEAASAGSANYRVDTQLKILIYDDSYEKSTLSNSGSVPVKIK